MPRFPQTAALIAQEGEAILEAILAHEDFTALVERKMEAAFMASVSELKAALDEAASSFDTLVGKIGQSTGGIDPVELDPILAEVKDLKAKIADVQASLPGKTTGTPDPTVGTAGTAPASEAPTV